VLPILGGDGWSCSGQLEGRSAEGEIKQSFLVDSMVHGEVNVAFKCEIRVCRGDLVF
jgi:hypothetical protein